jgi:beta-glucosidase
MQPLFPFGYGLSYTHFAYESLTLAANQYLDSDTISFDIAIRNVGARAGKEVVQVYIEAPGIRFARAPRELKAFAKIELQAGELGTVRMQIPVSTLACYDSALASWVVEAGSYRILAASSSRDVRLHADVRIDTRAPLPPLTLDCSLSELMRHHDAFARICQLFARKAGRTPENARRVIEINASSIFTGVYIALTAIFELDISRQEFRQALFDN